MKSGIYTITNTVNGKLYVGYATNIDERWAIHKCELKKNEHANDHLQNAWNKYGEENFKQEILEECEEQYLCSEENYWCNMLNAHDKRYGYNIQPTNPYGNPRLSQETKDKISKKHKGKKKTPETIENFRKAFGRNIIVLTDKGKYVKEYETLTDASQELKVGMGNMFKVLNGQQKSGKGYVFVYKDKYDPTKDYTVYRNYMWANKKVGKYSIDDILIEEYNSVRQAAVAINRNNSAIHGVLSGKWNTSGGYKWKYICS